MRGGRFSRLLLPTIALFLGIATPTPPAAALPAWHLLLTTQTPGVTLVRLAPPRVTMPSVGEEDVDIWANQLSTEKGHFVATGGATLTQGALRLTADRITGDQNTGDVVAEGRVVFTQPGQTVRGDRIIYNTDTRRVRAAVAETVVNGVIVRARDLDADPSKYTVSGASITTCDLPRPHYQLTARSVIVFPNDRIVARHVGIWLLGLRLFVVPRLTARIGAGRGEGGDSLFPRVGSNSRDGFFVGKVLPLIEERHLYLDFDGLLSVRRGLTGGFDTAAPLGSNLQLIGALKYRDEAPNQRTRFLEVDRLPELGVLWVSPTPTARPRRSPRHRGPVRSPQPEEATAAPAPAPPEFHPLRQVGSDIEHQPGLLRPPEPGRWYLRAQATAGYFHQREGLAAGGEAESLFRPRLDFRATASRAGLRVAGLRLPVLQFFARDSFYDGGLSFNVLGIAARQEWRLGTHWSSLLQAFLHHASGATPFAFDRVEIRTELQPALSYRWGGTTLSWLGRLDLDRGQLFDQEYAVARVLHCLEPRLSYRTRRRQIGLEIRIVGLQFE